MVQLDTELNVENISSEGKHDLFHFTYQGYSRKAHSYFESLSFVVIFSFPPLNHSGYFFLWSGLTHLKICFSWFFCLFFTYYVGSSLALSVWEFMLSTSVNVSHTLALSIIFFSLFLKLPQFTYQISFLSLPFLLFPVLFVFCYFLGNVYNSTFQFIWFFISLTILIISKSSFLPSSFLIVYFFGLMIPNTHLSSLRKETHCLILWNIWVICCLVLHLLSWFHLYWKLSSRPGSVDCSFLKVRDVKAAWKLQGYG